MQCLLRREGRCRSPLPSPRRGRNTLLHHRRWRLLDRQNRHYPRPRLDRANPRQDRRCRIRDPATIALICIGRGSEFGSRAPGSQSNLCVSDFPRVGRLRVQRYCAGKFSTGKGRLHSQREAGSYGWGLNDSPRRSCGQLRRLDLLFARVTNHSLLP